MSFPFSSTLPAFAQKARDQAQGGGFAAAGGTEQRHELLVMDIQIQPIQNALSIKSPISRSETTTELSILYVILLFVLRYEKRQEPAPIFLRIRDAPPRTEA